MTRHMHIVAGVAVNAINVNPADFPEWALVQSDSADIGDLWDGAVFTKPQPPPPTIPQAVTMRQARLALLAAGLLANVATAIASLPSPPKEEVGIEWEYSQTVERNRPFVQMLGTALGLDSAALDALFIAAAAL